MALFDQYDSKIPDYYNGMYLDGYKPHEILHAVRRKMVQQNEEQGDVGEFKIISEVKIKWKQKKDREKEKKRKQSILEKEIMSIMSKSLKTALDLALNDLLKDFKWKSAELPHSSGHSADFFVMARLAGLEWLVRKQSRKSCSETRIPFRNEQSHAKRG